MVQSDLNSKTIIETPFKGLIILLAGLFLCSLCRAAQQNLIIENSAISVSLDTRDATLSVIDKRTGETWRQQQIDKVKVIKSTATENSIEATLHHPGLDMNIEVKLQLDKKFPEFTLALSADSELKWALKFPGDNRTASSNSAKALFNPSMAVIISLTKSPVWEVCCERSAQANPSCK